MGTSHFHDLQAQSETTAQMLASRLKRMQASGLVERRPYSRRPLRYSYHLTQKGVELIPILLAFRAWGEKWCKAPKEALAVTTKHRNCGTELSLDGYCATCRQRVGWWEIAATPTPKYSDERRARSVSAS